MGQKVNEFADDAAAFSAEDIAWARGILAFELGTSASRDRIQAIQHWLGGRGQLAESAAVSEGAVKSWPMRGSVPKGRALKTLTAASGLSEPYVSLGALSNLTDLAVEEVRLNLSIAQFPAAGSSPARRAARAEAVAAARAAIATARIRLQAPPPGLAESGQRAGDARAAFVPVLPWRPPVRKVGPVAVERIEAAPMALSRAYIERLGLDPEALRYELAIGTAMAPTIPDGAVMIIDTNDKVLRTGLVYLFFIGGEPMPRRFVRRADLSGDLVADSADFPRETFTAANLGNLEIAGRIVWTAHLI